MATKTKIVMKTCSSCSISYPATEKYWRHNSATKDRWGQRCKPCLKSEEHARYIYHKPFDVGRRGQVGIKCILYANRCKVCEDLSACWRLKGHSKLSELPKLLQDKE